MAPVCWGCIARTVVSCETCVGTVPHTPLGKDCEPSNLKAFTRRGWAGWWVASGFSLFRVWRQEFCFRGRVWRQVVFSLEWRQVFVSVVCGVRFLSLEFGVRFLFRKHGVRLFVYWEWRQAFCFSRIASGFSEVWRQAFLEYGVCQALFSSIAPALAYCVSQAFFLENGVRLFCS